MHNGHFQGPCGMAVRGGRRRLKVQFLLKTESGYCFINPILGNRYGAGVTDM